MAHQSEIAREFFSRREDLTILHRAYELREILQGSVITREFDGKALGQHISLSPFGRQLLSAVTEHTPIDADVGSSALFVLFYANDVLFDTQTTNLDSITKSLSQSIRRKELLLPSRWGRTLYDKFNDLAEQGQFPYASLLTYDQTKLLLAELPQGIYQFGRLIAGPDGLIQSQCSRWLQSYTRVPLWHCSDPACESLHLVRLPDDKNNPLVEAAYSIARALPPTTTPPDWQIGLELSFGEPRNRDRHSDLGVLLLECLSVDDLRSLYMALVRADVIPRAIIREPLERHTSRLDRGALLTACLVADDSTLSRIIDLTIISRGIRIEVGEVRSPHHSARGWKRGQIEVSSLGIRTTDDSPIAAFISNILTAYEKTGTTKDLEWKLRKYNGESLADSLLQALARQGLPALARSVILDVRPIAEHFAALFDVSVARLDEGDVLLWKLGFDLPRLDNDVSSRVAERLNHFETTVQNHRRMQQLDRDAIRASGVNLFVDLEAALDEIICYIVWLLASDHFGNTHFVYRHTNARGLVASVLGATRESGAITVTWDKSGNNTLGVLLTYIQGADAWLSQLLEHDPASELRSVLPASVGIVPGQFPFRHNALWADVPHKSLQRLSSKIKEAVESINRSVCSSIRNGLDHTRDADEFPTTEAMLKCSTELRHALDALFEAGVIPLRQKISKFERDEFGVNRFTLRSIRGDIVCVSTDYVIGLPAHRTGGTFLVSPSDIIGFSNLPLVFEYAFESEYAQYRTNYPRRPLINVPIPAAETSPLSDAGDSIPGSIDNADSSQTPTVATVSETGLSPTGSPASVVEVQTT